MNSSSNDGPHHQDVIVISDDSESDASPGTSQMIQQNNKIRKTNNIKKTTKSNGQGNSNKTEKSHKARCCPICLDELGVNPLAATLCGHVFCLKCLEQSLIHYSRCPICKITMKKRTDYHPLSLPE